MDTISRENNSSMLPVGGIIIGVLALLIGGYAAISLSKINNRLTEMQPKIDRIDGVEAAANSAVAKADKTARDLTGVADGANGALKTVSDYITSLGERVTKIEEAAAAAKKAAPVAAKKGGGDVVAGPNEYIVKSGDSGMKIAAANGVSIGDLQAVNPGVNWNSMKPGQKLKLPAKR
jgi:LysM repeat protein